MDSGAVPPGQVSDTTLINGNFGIYPSPQVVADTFINQYYFILQYSPELAHKFYEESSIFSRPDSNGMMKMVTTTKAINDNIMSFYKNSSVQLATVDSQIAYIDGVFILVTGSLTGPDQIPRKFCQTFLLASRGKGIYNLLNDMFRFVGATQPQEIKQLVPKDSQEVAAVQDYDARDSATSLYEVVAGNGEVIDYTPEKGDATGEQYDREPVYHTSEKGDGTGGQELYSLSESLVPSDPPVPEVYYVEKRAMPQMTYASIVKENGSVMSVPNYIPTSKARAPRPASLIPETPITEPLEALAASTKPAPATEEAWMDNITGSQKDGTHDVEGYSVYIKNLSAETTVDEVEMEFQNFGSIVPGGVQVKRQQSGPNCFGFVEFESLKSMQDAIMASPVIVAGRRAYVEEKRTSIRVRDGVIVSGTRGPPGSGGYKKNDNFRGNAGDNYRGNGGYGGNYGYGGDNYRGTGGDNHRGSAGYGGYYGAGRNGFRNQGSYSESGWVQVSQRKFQNDVSNIQNGVRKIQSGY